MTILLATLAVAFAASCMWLTVRIVNRRERWAKWTLAVVVGLPLLYPVSFGPACWLFGGKGMPFISRSLARDLYKPLVNLAIAKKPPMGPALWWWSALGCERGAGELWMPDLTDSMVGP